MFPATKDKEREREPTLFARAFEREKERMEGEEAHMGKEKRVLLLGVEGERKKREWKREHGNCKIRAASRSLPPRASVAMR